ncbi:MAG: serine hydrolase, partial [Ornithinibacter sp.]
WDSQEQWDAGPASADVLASSAGEVRKDFMVPYPASVLKVMVGYGVLRLVDQGTVTLGTRVTYHEVGGKTCGYGPSNPSGASPAPEADGASDTVSSWMDQMITVSDNFATCVLLQLLNDTGGLKATNSNFAALGLGTLRMNPSQPEVGNGWSSGQMTMGALDTARLMLLASGTTRQLWRAPDGSMVTGDTGLSRSSQEYFRSVLLDQSFHEVLSTGNLCGSDDAAPGIPALVSQRWIDSDTGHVVTYDGDTPLDFGYDTRPCNATAEVTFAHKTGLVSFSGNDTGIVKALPGEDGRWYVVAAHSNVGYRFGDTDWADSDPNACLGAPYVCYSRAYGRVGAAVDSLVKARPNSAR